MKTTKKVAERRRCPRCGQLWPRFKGRWCFDCTSNLELPLPAQASQVR
jgi:hypothetical protein